MSSFIRQGEIFTQVLKLAIRKTGRLAVADIEPLFKTKRDAQRCLYRLAGHGYLIGDRCAPQGFKPTDKAKQLFEVQHDTT